MGHRLSFDWLCDGTCDRVTRYVYTYIISDTHEYYSIFTDIVVHVTAEKRRREEGEGKGRKGRGMPEGKVVMETDRKGGRRKRG